MTFIVDTLEPTKTHALIEDTYQTRWFLWDTNASLPWRPVGASSNFQDERFADIEFAREIHPGFDETGDDR